MTTAHRPTWAPAKGGDNEGGFKSYAGTRMTRVKDLNAGGDLKFRHDLDADGAPADLRAALEARERKAAREARAAAFDEEKEKDLLMLEGGGGGDQFAVKRAFGDDTVFRNAARAPPSKASKQFVNDTVRSDFHKRFMRRFFA
jgi:protein CWC15